MAPATAEAQGSMTPGQPAHRPLPTAPSTAPTQSPNSATSASATDFAILFCSSTWCGKQAPDLRLDGGAWSRKHVPTQPPSHRRPRPPVQQAALSAALSTSTGLRCLAIRYEAEAAARWPWEVRRCHAQVARSLPARRGSSSDIVTHQEERQWRRWEDGGETVVIALPQQPEPTQRAHCKLCRPHIDRRGTSPRAIHAAKKGSKRAVHSIRLSLRVLPLQQKRPQWHTSHRVAKKTRMARMAKHSCPRLLRPSASCAGSTSAQ